MREYNFNIRPYGLKNSTTAINGHNALQNLKVEDGYWSVPKAIQMPWATGQLLRGRNVVLLWKENEFPEGYIGITTAEQLQLIGSDEELWPNDGYYVLLQDISGCADFVPIPEFNGTLDGNYHSITDLSINRPDDDNQAIIQILTGTVKNLTVTATITANMFVGIICATNTGEIINCHASGTINANTCVGGIAGNITLGTVSYSSFNGTISGYDACGGIAGSSDGFIYYCQSDVDITTTMDGGGIVGLIGLATGDPWKVKYCSSSGTVHSISDYAGGLVGNCSGVIEDCYSNASVSSDTGRAGGLLGCNHLSVAHCYSVGQVTSTLKGGLIGTLEEMGEVIECYYDSETSGCEDDDGRGVPKTTEEMVSFETFSDWDEDTWDIESSYPFLRAGTVPVSAGFRIVNDDLSTSDVFGVGCSAKWQMADYGDFIVLTDGVRTAVYDDGTMSLSSVHLDCVCAVDGRLFYSKGNSLFYSMIGGEDIENILSGTALNDTDYARNEDGEAMMPFNGDILAIKRLGENIVVYGSNGIAVIGSVLDMPQLMEIPGVPGLYSRESIDGDLNRHVFRAVDGTLWGIAADMKPVRLDFAWLLDDHSTIVFDELLNEFWITNGSESYLMTNHGVSGPIDQCPLSIITMNGESVATGTSYGDTIPVLVHTNTFDMAQNGQKRVTVVNMNGEFTNARVGVLLKYTTSDSWRELPPVKCSPEGACFLNVELVYGQLKIHANALPENRVMRIEVRFQQDDRRFVRGTRGFSNSQDGDSDT